MRSFAAVLVLALAVAPCVVLGATDVDPAAAFARFNAAFLKLPDADGFDDGSLDFLSSAMPVQRAGSSSRYAAFVSSIVKRIFTGQKQLAHSNGTDLLLGYPFPAVDFPVFKPGGFSTHSVSERQGLLVACCAPQSDPPVPDRCPNLCDKLEASELALITGPDLDQTDFNNAILMGLQVKLAAIDGNYQDSQIIAYFESLEQSGGPIQGEPMPHSGWRDHVLGQGGIKRWDEVLPESNPDIQEWQGASDMTARHFDDPRFKYPYGGNDNNALVFGEVAEYVDQLPQNMGGLSDSERAQVCQIGVDTMTLGVLDTVALWRVHTHPASFAFFHKSWKSSSPDNARNNALGTPAGDQVALDKAQVFMAMPDKMAQYVTEFTSHFCS